MSIYFDNAATSSPKPPEVVDAVMQALTRFNANPGRSGHRAALEAGRIVLDTRRRLQELIGAEDPSCVIFAFNCTDALNLAIKGTLRFGDHAVATLLDHNSVLRPLNELAVRGRISLTLVEPRPDGFIAPSDIAGALRANTRLIVMPHASNVTGAIQPVAAVGQIARERGVRYLIDGAQALGGAAGQRARAALRPLCLSRAQVAARSAGNRRTVRPPRHRAVHAARRRHRFRFRQHVPAEGIAGTL